METKREHFKSLIQTGSSDAQARRLSGYYDTPAPPTRSLWFIAGLSVGYTLPIIIEALVK